MRGLLDWASTPEGIGLLSAAFGGLAGARPGQPLNSLGRAGLAGITGFSNALEAQAARETREQKGQMQTLQMQELQQRMAAAKRAEEEAQRARDEAAAKAQARGSFLGSIDQSAGPAMPFSVPQAMLAGLSQQEIQALMPAKAENPFGKVDPKDYTPESVRKFAMTNNFADLVPARKVEFVDGRAVDPFNTAPGTVIPQRAAPSSLAQMIAERDQLPNGSPLRAIYDNAIAKATTHQPGVSVTYGAPVAGMDTAGNPVFFQPDKAGGQPNIVPGVKPPQKDSALTEAQAKAATFMSQMKAAERELSGIPIDPAKIWSQVDVAMAGGLTNFAASPAAQRARQAQEQWSESFLRFKTGAASTKDEVILNARTFFPQPGDSADVIAQKQRMRQQAVQDIAFAAGQKASAPQQPGGQPDAPLAPKPTKRWNPSTNKFEPVGG